MELFEDKNTISAIIRFGLNKNSVNRKRKRDDDNILKIIVPTKRFKYDCSNEDNKDGNEDSSEDSKDSSENSGDNPCNCPDPLCYHRRFKDKSCKTCSNPVYDNSVKRSDSKNESKDSVNRCPNPLCDHKDKTIIISPPLKQIDTIDDLIQLGKNYHCKSNRDYYGINLETLCNLVEPLTELNRLVGMKDVKRNIINHIVFFLQGFNVGNRCNSCKNCLYNLKCEQQINKDMLHTIITGPPGVGKTELGKILGLIYKGMGVLSGGELHIAKRSDLIGKYLGHTAKLTQQFIDKCKGGVMFLDEAYSLGNEEGKDSFSKECIDTINQNLTENRDFLCIVAGYEESLETCFFKYNPGLKRRFTFRYNIDKYSSDELMEIFLQKIVKESWSSEFHKFENKKGLLSKFFNGNIRYFPHYGGDVETFFLCCKIVHARRVLFKNDIDKRVITMEDIKNSFNNYIRNRKYRDSGIPDHIKMLYT